jgi:hypothetical protein
VEINLGLSPTSRNREEKIGSQECIWLASTIVVGGLLFHFFDPKKWTAAIFPAFTKVLIWPYLARMFFVCAYYFLDHLTTSV